MNREIIDLNAFQCIIEVLLQDGYTIIQIVSNPYNVFYYAVLEFEPPYQGGGQTIEYGYLKGINITDFLQKNSANDARHIAAKMQDIMLHSQVITMNFSNKVEWYKYSAAVK